MPKLKPEAGALRCSVLAEQIARAAKDLNPTSQGLERRRHEQAPPPMPDRRVAKAVSRAPTPAGPDQRDEQAIRESANRALAAMAKTNAGQAEDFVITESDKLVLESLSVVFQPVWHAKNNMITAYVCALVRNGKPITKNDTLELFPQDSPDLAFAKLDARLYGGGAKAMNYLLAEGLKAVLIVPIHFTTVDRLRYIGALLEQGSDLPEEARNLLVFELIHLPSDISRFRLREPVNYLRSRARALVAQLGMTPTGMDIFKELSFHGVSIDLRHHSYPEDRLLKNFDAFTALAEKYNLRSFVHGISGTSLAVGAIASGFTYIGGPAISEPVGNPKQIRPYEIDMLYEG